MDEKDQTLLENKAQLLDEEQEKWSRKVKAELMNLKVLCAK
jgi:hypothetical protein